MARLSRHHFHTQPKPSWLRRIVISFLAIFTPQKPLEPTIPANPRASKLPPFSQDSFSQSLNKEELAELPLISYSGPIYVIQSPHEVKLAVKALSKESILGFDTETRPVFRRGEYYPVALLQLTGESATYIFQLSLIAKALKPIANILSDPNILKVGVAIREDIRKLQERIHFKPKGFIEISDLSRDLGIQQTGLRNLAGILLGVRISKAVQVSNWAMRHLTRAQVQYAATDSWISKIVYERCKALLDSKRS